MTCIVVFKSPALIVVGADSLGVLATDHSPAGQVDKLTSLGSSAVYGAAGRHGIYSFSSHAVAVESFEGSESLDETVDKFTDAVMAEYLEQVKLYVKNEPDVLASLQSTKYVLETIFAGLENGILKVFAIKFKLLGDNHENLYLEVVNFVKTGEETGCFFLGFSLAAAAELQRIMSIEEEFTEIEAVNSCLRAEVTENSNFVGGPLKFVTINQSHLGTFWTD